MEKELRKKIFILGALVVALVVLIVVVHTKDCGEDEVCFDENAAECDRVKAEVTKQGNVFLYEVKGEKNIEGEENCMIKISLLKLNEGTSASLKKALEGKGMLCSVPRTLLSQQLLSKIENINDYCSGPLKELLLQISLDKLYEVVVKNIGPLSLKFSQSLSQLNETITAG